MNHRFLDLTKVVFWDSQKAKMCAKGSLTTWNIASSTSPKSHFRYARKYKMPSLVPGNALIHRFLDVAKVVFWDRQEVKMCRNAPPTTCNIAFSISPKSHFG